MTLERIKVMLNSRKVAGSIPEETIELFSIHLIVPRLTSWKWMKLNEIEGKEKYRVEISSA
jgi:hypothetical protein